jgi:hypothetical protein
VKSEVTRTSSSGRSKGRGFRITALKTEKIATSAPIPRASVPMATAAKPGLLLSVRRA